MNAARQGRGAANGGSAYINSPFWDNLKKKKKEEAEKRGEKLDDKPKSDVPMHTRIGY